ncbi:MAG: 3 4-dihydroxy 2-butanone 4-phosphate synthase / GTP cyclohydrolase II [Puniceicoccaceae bacterium 5H]|nr:MAG: 3 4-dihydroxy 2-butanone 4-phosphate synthase / GTP cyclohydrolase II [Puniceicoccaceae bacterium 5H]
MSALPDPDEAFDSIEAAIDDIAAGKLVIVTDDEDRENEGDLVMAASLATPEAVNMMIRHARGLICVPTTENQLKRLGLNMMVAQNRESHGTAFTVSVDAAHNVTTGISAADRCEAVRVMGDPHATADQLVTPGHIFPLRARPGGVLERAGHTEAAVDLVSLAGLSPTGAICEILNEDGSVARLPELREFKQEHGLKMVSIKQLIEYRLSQEMLVDNIGETAVENEFGSWTLRYFRSQVDHSINFALVKGELSEAPTLVRVHAENVLADVFGARLPNRGDARTLHEAMRMIADVGTGCVLYLSQPCGGLKIPGNLGSDTHCQQEGASRDARAYGIGAQILRQLGLRQIRLISSHSRRRVALAAYGLEIVEQVGL